jgi:hypothetical protein
MFDLYRPVWKSSKHMDSRRSQDCFRSIQESLHKLGKDEQAVYSSSNLKPKTSNA